MYLRHTTRLKDGKTHTYWRLVRSVRRGGRVVHETVAQLGELFAIQYDLLLYDVTSTSFEGAPRVAPILGQLPVDSTRSQGT